MAQAAGRSDGTGMWWQNADLTLHRPWVHALLMTRKASTFRLDPAVQAGLAVLSEVQGRPQNQLVNEAVRELVAKRAREVVVDLSATLKRLKAFQASDPTGEASIEAAMRAEAAVEQDPAQGKRVQGQLAVGPASARMLEILGG